MIHLITQSCQVAQKKTYTVVMFVIKQSEKPSRNLSPDITSLPDQTCDGYFMSQQESVTIPVFTTSAGSLGDLKYTSHFIIGLP